MAQWELDSFYSKFKNLLCAEKNATLTLKSEAGKAFVTLSLDLGHVLSGQDLHQQDGLRNGPARQRRREKRAAAREEKLSATENVEAQKVDLTEKAEETPATDNHNAEEAAAAEKANEMNDCEKEATEKVEVIAIDVKDELCPDETYKNETKQFTSVETQTLECGVKSKSKSAMEFYTLTYDDYDSED